MDSSEFKKKVQIPKRDSNDEKAYCTLCKVLLRAGALDDHLKGKKHKRKQEKSATPKIDPTNFIITDPTQMPYYCALCQVSCGSQNEHVKHFAGIKHKDKANKEKVKENENEFPKGATMLLSDEQFMEGFEDDKVMLKTKDNSIRIIEGEEETVVIDPTVCILKTQNSKKRGLGKVNDQSDFIELAEKKFKKNA